MKLKYIALGLAILVLAIGYEAISSASPHQAYAPAQQNYFIPKDFAVIQLTDPGYLPNGTRALVIDFSSAKVHYVSQQGSGWVGQNASGSIDLLSLDNLTTAIGKVSLPVNSIVDQVSFNITGANISIGGSSYPVYLPEHTVSTGIEGNPSINGTEGVLVGLDPVIAVEVDGNSIVFTMVPSAKAVVVENGTTNAQVGSVRILSPSDRRLLENSVLPIGVSNASIESEGNASDISLVISNHGSKPIYIDQVIIVGNMSVGLNFSNIINISADFGRAASIAENKSRNSSESSTNATGLENMTVVGKIIGIAANASAGILANATVIGNYQKAISAGFNGISIDADAMANTPIARFGSNASAVEGFLSTHGVNMSIMKGLSINLSQIEGLGSQISGSVQTGLGFEKLRTVNFFVSRNGTMVPMRYAYTINSTQYELNPGSSNIITFNGDIIEGSGNETVRFVNGGVYRIYVMGQNGAFGSVNVTAK